MTKPNKFIVFTEEECKRAGERKAQEDSGVRVDGIEFVCWEDPGWSIDATSGGEVIASCPDCPDKFDPNHKHTPLPGGSTGFGLVTGRRILRKP